MTVLRGSVAVVTGASRGIGQAIAAALAAEGAQLWLLGRQPDALRHACPGQRYLRADLAVDAEVEAAADAIGREAPRVDVLVHAAGVLAWAPFHAAAAAQFDAQYRTNVRAPYVLTQRLLTPLQAARGQVVFVNSSAGLTAKAHVGQYAATKHALKAVADSLREEVNDSGVRVLSLFVGRTATQMQEDLHAIEGKAYQPDALIQPADVATVALQALTVPRSVEVTDILMRPMRRPPA